jgi:hypothetical protein
MLMADVFGSRWERTAQDSYLIVLEQLFARLFALSFDIQCVRFLCSDGKGKDQGRYG